MENRHNAIWRHCNRTRKFAGLVLVDTYLYTCTVLSDFVRQPQWYSRFPKKSLCSVTYMQWSYLHIKQIQISQDWNEIRSPQATPFSTKNEKNEIWGHGWHVGDNDVRAGLIKKWEEKEWELPHLMDLTLDRGIPREFCPVTILLTGGWWVCMITQNVWTWKAGLCQRFVCDSSEIRVKVRLHTAINQADFVSRCMLYTYDGNKMYSWENDTVLSYVNH